MSKKSISIYELIELVRASVYSGTIKKDYPDYLDECRKLGISSYVLNLIIQREKDIQKNGRKDDYMDLLFIEEKKGEESSPPSGPPPIKLPELPSSVPPPVPNVDPDDTVRIPSGPTPPPVKPHKEATGCSVAWFLVSLLLIVSFVLLTCMLNYYTKNKDLSDELMYSQNQLSHCSDVLRNISNLTNEVQEDKSLGGWVSTNHDHSSVSEKEFKFYASPGDKLSFNYRVSSEKYDSLIVVLSLEGENQPIQKMRASEIVNSSRAYVIDKKGNYCLYVKYQKDGSVNNYDDKAEVTNIIVRRNQKSVLDNIQSLCGEVIDNSKEVIDTIY